MDKGVTTAGVNRNGDYQHNAPSQGEPDIIETEVNRYQIPKSKEDLNSILTSYYKLLVGTKEWNGDYLKGDVEGQPDDPYGPEKAEIESILSKIDKQQKRFEDEESEFMNELSNIELNQQGELDLELLGKQVAGFSLLSRDYDLPESLQRQFVKDVPRKETQSFVDKAVAELTNISVDFETRAKESGIEAKSPLTAPDPKHAPLGNLYVEKIITTKIAQRLKELENLPANIGTFDGDTLDDVKIKALIELKGLRLLNKQKQLKHAIISHESQQVKYVHPHLKNLPICLSEKRSFSLRSKIEQQNPQLLAVQLEQLKKEEAKELKRQLHIAKVDQILESSLEKSNEKLVVSNYRSYHLPKQINNFHQITEKEESKKLEKNAKSRLQALKANDEEAYLKLLDETKDHRITHLLKQTNQFLDSLTEQVRAQQDEADGNLGTPRSASPEVMATTAAITEDGSGGVLVNSKDELREKTDYYEVAHKVKEKIVEQPTILVGGKLKEYQIKGLEWMVSLYNNHLNGILADEMGLGKTIQSISLITYLIEKKHESKFLVIVPLSTITNWTLEFEKWAPSVKIIVYKGSQQQRRSLQSDVRYGNFQVMLTTYEYVIRERPLLAKFHYSHMIIDEGHRMKNANSKLSQTLRQYYKTKNRLILTGTPLQNNLPELWALLNFVLPKIFNSVKSFDEWFNTPFANTGAQEKIELTEEESLLVIRRLHKVLRPFLLRRLKKDVEKDLPDKVEKVLKCNLSGLQYVLYQQMLKHNALFVGAEVGGAKSGIKGLNNKIMQLRKICNHPFVFEEVETVLDSSKLTNDLIWRTSGKFELLDRILPKFKKSGHRVLMFFQMTQIMDIMEDFLRFRDLKYLRLDGSTKADERQDMLKVFNAPDSDYFCFLLSTRAGGLGLNLQTADTVVIFDTDWNPHQDLQAQDRAHRIGQKNEVRILRLITNDSVEEVILERAHQKLDIDGKVIQAGKFDNKSTAEEQEEFLKRLLEADATGGDNDENDSLDDEELNEILARSEQERELFTKLDEERKQHDQYGQHRLIEKDELPKIFTEDISHHFEKNTEELGRMREKKRVMYDDGLSEAQWLKAMDDDNDSVEDAIKRRMSRINARKRNKASREGLLVEDINDDEVGEEDDEDFEAVAQPRKRQRRSKTPVASSTKDEQDKSEGSEFEGDVTNEVATNGSGASDDLEAQCLAVLDEIMELTDESDGHKLSELFVKLPSRKLYPDYYSVIKYPISLNQMRKKIQNEVYGSFDEFVVDVKQMCLNAKTFNQEGSFVHADAIVIEDLIDSKVNRG
ncbi:snf21 [Candida margitis]|uniref:snf21 n=1 Tax=Candida margitis TaxID=1775924 RepID=UPI002226CE8B|nr:snf21 [Candida margitis]KAI5970402.1 snf21 [Candida margitis]